MTVPSLWRPPANTLLLLPFLALLLLLQPLHAFRPLLSLSSCFSQPPPQLPSSSSSSSSSQQPRTCLFATSKTDYYSILGLAPGATPAEVKRAFRERAKNTHPDASRTTDTTKEFLVIKEAYETLYDGQRRAEFDRRRQMAEVAELAVSVGEILTMDIAVPLARDVAIPLIKTAFQGLDQTLIKQFAGPILKTTLEQSAAAVENMRQVAHDRAQYFTQVQAAWRAEEIRSLSQQLDVMTLRAKGAQEQARSSAEAASLFLDREGNARTSLEAAEKEGQSLAQQAQELREESALAMSAFKAVVAEEEGHRQAAKKLKMAETRAVGSSKRLEQVVLAADAEMAEAEEVLRQARLRVERAREARHKAEDQFLASQAETKEVRDTLELANTVLTEASAAVVPHRQKWEDIQAKHTALLSSLSAHAKREQLLKQELAAAARKREASHKEFELTQKQTTNLQRQVRELAAQIDKKYNEGQSGSGIMSASGASSPLSASVEEPRKEDGREVSQAKPEERKKKQREAFELVFGSVRRQQKEKAASAAAAAAVSAATESAAATVVVVAADVLIVEKRSNGIEEDNGSSSSSGSSSGAEPMTAGVEQLQRLHQQEQQQQQQQQEQQDALDAVFAASAAGGPLSTTTIHTTVNAGAADVETKMKRKEERLEKQIAEREDSLNRLQSVRI